MAESEPKAYRRYFLTTIMIMRMDDFVMSHLTPGPFELCAFMRMADDFSKERRIVKDAFHAYAAIALFFEGSEFLQSTFSNICDSDTVKQLLDQDERAKSVPDRRTYLSNKTMPSGFWEEFDKLLRDNERQSDDTIEDIYPEEWRKAIRPIVVTCKFPVS
jgi:hypothetical protein